MIKELIAFQIHFNAEVVHKATVTCEGGCPGFPEQWAGWGAGAVPSAESAHLPGHPWQNRPG